MLRRNRDRRPGPPALVTAILSGALSCRMGIWGPAARTILESVTTDDVSNGAFGYMTARQLSVGHVPLTALRVTYVGELGWELYCPMEYGLALWDTLWTAGRPHGLVAGGYRAIDSLRLEKGYRVWSSDITPEENPYEAGVGFAVRLKKQTGFIGRDALAVAIEQPLARKLACLVLDDPLAVALGNEPVRSGRDVVGRVTSGGYGFAVERSIAYGYLPPALAEPGQRVEVEIFGDWVGGTVSAEPLYDPDGARVRA